MHGPQHASHWGFHCLALCYRGAGTDANVFLELHGEGGTLGPCRLDSAANNFERNQTDIFPLRNCTCIGKVTKAVLWHDNTGFSADWHVAQVDVKGPGVLGDPHGAAKVLGELALGFEAAAPKSPAAADATAQRDGTRTAEGGIAAVASHSAAEPVVVFPVHKWLRKNDKEGLAGCRTELVRGEPGAE